MGGDDLFLAALRYAPLLFGVAGVLVVVWLLRERLPYELQPDVLAAVSETGSPLTLRRTGRYSACRCVASAPRRVEVSGGGSIAARHANVRPTRLVVMPPRALRPHARCDGRLRLA